MNKCENCFHYEMCMDLLAYQKNVEIEKVKSLMNDVVCKKYSCNHYKDKSLFVELPVKVGQTVYVDSRTLPTDKISLFDMGIYNDEMPKFFEGKVISIRQNCKGWFVKIGITAHWIKSYWGDEIGEDFYTSHMSKYFTYPKGAFGITVFLTKEDAEAKLKEIENESV